MATLFNTEAKWKLAFVTANTQFDLQGFQPEQREPIKFFFKDKNVLVNLHTGLGKR